MTKRLVIVGAGEFAQIAFEYFTHDSPYSVIAFGVDKDFLPKDDQLCGIPVLELALLANSYLPGDVEVFVAIPATDLNRTRQMVCDRVEKMGYSLASYVSSKAFVWQNVPVGKNTFIFEGNVVQPFAAIGDRCILWSGNHIGHRTIIENDVFLSSHVVVSGYCSIGHHSFLGVNATLNDHITIAPDCVIGAGAHVNRNTKSGGIYVGTPARAIPGRSSRDVKL